ncbi:MAG: NAD-dependent epimerase/dehydratase family protein [FCB group bacterium]|nr:NAD-dependent epimerase/dehydratase family protein [FCB group bacterium]
MSLSILVTGGAGFIGSHLVDTLLEFGHRVTVIDNFNEFYDPGIKRLNCRPHLEHENYRLINDDIRDRTAVDDCVEQGGFDEIIHLAAMAGVRPSLENPILYGDVNVMGTVNLLEACHKFGVKKFIFGSSSSVYGNNEKVPFAEDDPVDNPISPYAATKKAGELLVYTYHRLYDIKTACLRFFTVYGPRQRPEMAIHFFTDQIYHGREIPVFAGGKSRRDYTFVSDIVAGIMACHEHNFDYQVINLGRSDTVGLSDLIKKIELALDKTARIKIMPTQPGDVDQTFADIDKAKRLLEYYPQVSIDAGIEKFVTWFLERQEKR